MSATGTDRKLIQDLYVRCCKDSGFRFDAIRAAQFSASVLGIHPLEVWLAMPSFDVMQKIAAGKHPVVSKSP